MIDLLNENTNLSQDSFKIPSIVNGQIDLVNVYNKEYEDDWNYFSTKMDRYDEFDVVIQIPGNNILLNSVTLEFPMLKYDKQFVWGFSSDDSNHGIYNQAQTYVNGRYVSLVSIGGDQSRLLLPRAPNGGFVNDKRLGYTDGVSSNIIPFRMGANIIPKNLSHIPDGGGANPHLTWEELTSFMDFYGSVGYHESGNRYDSQQPPILPDGIKHVVQLKESIDMLGAEGIYPTYLQNANGDGNYRGAFESILSDVYSVVGGQATNNAYNMNSDNYINEITNIRKLPLYRYFAGTETMSVNGVPSNPNNIIQFITDKQSKPYSLTYYGTHEVYEESFDITNDTITDNNFGAILRKIDEYWGASGNNTVWGCQQDELYQWLFAKKYSTITKTIDTNAKEARFHITVPHLKNTYHDSISLVCPQLTTKSGVTVKSFGDIYNDNSGVVNGKLLINLNYDKSIITRVEKYLKIAEDNVYNNALFSEYLADAELFFNMLSDNRKTYHGFLTRYNNIALPPTITGVVLNNDNATTANPTLTVTVGFSSLYGSPTHYMASESNLFPGGTWKSFNKSTGEFNYTLTNTSVGNKYIYVKLKTVSDNKASSYIKSNPIYFQGLNHIDISSVVVNSGNTTTLVPNVSVKLNTLNVPALKYRLSLNSVDILSLPWTTGSTNGEVYTSNSILTSFNLPSVGNYIIYGQVSDQYGLTTSTVQSSSISYATVSLNTMIVNSGGTETTGNTVLIDFTYSGTPTNYRITDTGTFTSDIAFTGSPINFTFTSTAGYKTIGMLVKDSLSSSGILNQYITYNPNININSFSIPSNITNSNVVNISMDVQNATQMRFGLSSNLSGSTWETYSTGKTYTLPVTAGTYTIYSEFKHVYKNVSTNTGAITLSGLTTLISAYIENDASTTTNIPATVNITSSGSPYQMMVSESPIFSSATWVTYSTGATIVLTSTSAIKTVYVKLRDINGIETQTVSDTIDYTYVAPPTKLIIALNGGNNGTITGGTYAGQFYNSTWPGKYIGFSNTQLYDTTNNPFGTFIKNLSEPVDMLQFGDPGTLGYIYPDFSTAPEAGPYPDALLHIPRAFETANNGLTDTPGFRLVVLNGTYTVRILGSSGPNLLTNTDYNNQVYIVKTGSGTINQTPTQSLLNNSTYFMTFNNVIVNNTFMDIYIGRINSTTTQTPINLIELTKIN